MNILKTIAIAVTTIAFAQSAIASCTYPSDRASDGSRCGGRASTVRPGGKAVELPSQSLSAVTVQAHSKTA